MPSHRSEAGPIGDRELAHLRAQMVERHVAARGVRDPRVLDAMAEVPRHLFVPPALAAKAYGPGALPIGQGQTISQPYIVGRMIELLELSGTEKVLEVGTGTGYQAVVLSLLAARVFSIERHNELAMTAVELVRRLRLHNVSVKVFDGTYGWSDQAPFDRIIVAAAAPEVPEPLVQQLARNGRMVLPLGPPGNQRLARVSKVATRLQIEDCGSAEFVPLVGRFGWKQI
ncbi:MAG: protein-L-isoaspartate(D-aspartate) O-methyltransferase [Thermoanaerobaculia bacterium]